MLARLRRFWSRLAIRQRGSMAVEFAILAPVFILAVFGIVDFGHAWYMEHIMVNASREGARYGARFTTDTHGNRLVPTQYSPAISTYVTTNWGLAGMLPCDANLQVTPSGAGWNETDPSRIAGEDLTITISATKNWFVIGSLVPGLGSSKNITVATTMKCE